MEMKETQPNIRIYVACHKPSYVPENPLLVPVMAGAAFIDDDTPFKDMRGILRDDAGDNIS